MLRHAAAPRPYWPQRRGSGLIANTIRSRRVRRRSGQAVDLGSQWGQYEYVTNLGFAACPLTGRLRVTGDVPAPAPASARHSAERFKRLGAH